MQKKWNILPRQTEEAKNLSAVAGISEPIAGILVNRGFTSPEEVKKFLYPEKEQEFYDPFLMRDMDKAVNRIEEALAKEEHIVIYGDYDVDGITATAVLFRCLTQLGAKVSYYIPDRQSEGYGINIKALEKFVANGISLIISVDCGISSVEEIAEMKDRLSFVITDHHLPLEHLPEAEAVVNPHRKDCSYPDKNLAGVGVAYKLCQALIQKIKGEEYYADLELAALGTVADIVPLIGENRRIVKQGIKALSKTKIIGLQELISVASVDTDNITTESIGFMIAPRLNAAGRMLTAKQGVELLLSDNRKKAGAIADELNDANQERQHIEQEILKQLEDELCKQDIDKLKVIVVAGKDWHSGVVGIVASKLVDKYYKPAVVISLQNGIGKGSCRSIKKYSLFDALTNAENLLIKFGGHTLAAGLTVKEENIDALRESLTKYAEENLVADDYIPEIDIDYELPPDKIDFTFIEELSLLEPYGMANPKPYFAWRNLQGYFAKAIGKEKNHLSFELSGKKPSIRAIAWNMADYVNTVNNSPVDIVFVPEINEWQGKRSVQCKLQDLRVTEGKTVISRDELGKLYLFLKKQYGQNNMIKENIAALSLEYGSSEYFIQQAFTIFEELGIIFTGTDGMRKFQAPPPGEKLNLNASDTYKNQKL